MTRRNDITARGTAVEIGAAMHAGEAQFYTTATPLTALLAEESPDVSADRTEALTAIMAYLFSSSPHPAVVLHRLYLLAKEAEPERLKTLAAVDVQRLVGCGPDAHLYRVAAIIRGTRVEQRPAYRHDRVIHHTLAAASYWMPAVESNRLRPLAIEDVLDTKDGETLRDYESRLRAIGGVLRYFFYDGPQPEDTIVRVYAIAKANYSQLILDMTVRQLGELFGVTGAAWSERIKQIYNRFLEERGAIGSKSRFQKSDEACDHYADAQKGNSNRRKGRRNAA